MHILILLLLCFGTQSLNAKSSTVLDLTQQNFTQTIHGKQPVLVKFWAPWCRPCREMSPRFAHVSKSFVGKVLFAELNVDQQKQIAGNYRVHSIPTTILFINGEEMDRFRGGLSREQIAYWAGEIVKGRYK